jgi:hypothetical protein
MANPNETKTEARTRIYRERLVHLSHNVYNVMAINDLNGKPKVDVMNWICLNSELSNHWHGDEIRAAIAMAQSRFDINASVTGRGKGDAI